MNILETVSAFRAFPDLLSRGFAGRGRGSLFLAAGFGPSVFWVGNGDLIGFLDFELGISSVWS